MTAAAELFKKYVGKRAYWHGKGCISFGVYVLDAKVSWGNEIALIRPAVGKGQKWVNVSNLTLED